MTLRHVALPVLALALVAAACSSGSSATPSPSAPASASGPGQSPLPSPTAAAAPTLLPSDPYALPAFDFSTYQHLLGQLEGTPVVVNVWASWCGPCRDEAPFLAAAAKKYAGSVQFLGVDILDSRTAARAFMREFGWTYPSVFDETGAIRDQLGLIGQPVTLFYARSGKLVSTWMGPLTVDVLDARVRQLLS